MANKKEIDGIPPIPDPDNRSTKTRKKAMLICLEKAFGVISLAARYARIDRVTHYRWLEKDAKYAAACEELRIAVKDFGENALHKKVAEGDTVAIIFFNKTQNKDRGYVEGLQVTGANGQPLIPKRQIMKYGGNEIEF